MSFSLIYLTHRFFYRIWMFLDDWYISAFFAFVHRGNAVIERLDRYWALGITVRNLFKPLYQDQSIVGRILGFFFRFIRTVIGAFLYAVVFAIFTGAYIIWALVPIYIVASIFM